MSTYHFASQNQTQRAYKMHKKYSNSWGINSRIGNLNEWNEGVFEPDLDILI